MPRRTTPPVVIAALLAAAGPTVATPVQWTLGSGGNGSGFDSGARWNDLRETIQMANGLGVKGYVVEWNSLAVPSPGTAALLALGLFAGARASRRGDRGSASTSNPNDIQPGSSPVSR